MTIGAFTLDWCIAYVECKGVALDVGTGLIVSNYRQLTSSTYITTRPIYIYIYLQLQLSKIQHI